MRSSLRKFLLLGAGLALPLTLAGCGGNAPPEDRFDGRERMSRPAPAAFAPVPPQSAEPAGRTLRGDPVRRPPAVAYGETVPPAWQPAWTTGEPMALAEPPQEAGWVPDYVESYEPDPAPPALPAPSAGLVVASLLESFIGSPAPEAASPPRRWGRGDDWRRAGHPRRNREDRHDGSGGYGERPRHRPPPVGGARPDRPGRPSPAPTESAQSLPRAVPLVRVPAAERALGNGRPQAERVEREGTVATVDREEIRAAREAARRDEEQRAASAWREAEERQGWAREEDMQREAAREAEAQRVREAEQYRLAAEARRAASEAQRLAAADQQARAAREQAEREQRQALALARRDDPPAIQPQPQTAPAAQPAPLRGPAPRLDELDGRRRARGKPMAGADLE